MPARKLITMFDRERTLAEWMAELRSPVPASTVRVRLARGWDPFEAITRPFDRAANAAFIARRKEIMRNILADTGGFPAFGKFLSVEEWARERGLRYAALRARLRRGIERGDSFESILALPRQPARPETPRSIALRERRPVPIAIPSGPTLWAFVREVEWPNPSKVIIALRQVTGHRQLRRLGLSFARRELGENCVAIGVVPPAVLAWRSRANPLHWLVVKPWDRRLLAWSHELAPDCPIPGKPYERGRRKGQFRPS